MRQCDISRRSVLVGAFMMSVSATVTSARGETIIVHRDPSCGCCGAWVEHLKKSGFTTEVTETASLNRVRSKLGVPKSLASCHTAEINEYIVEGHVPAGAIRRLLLERPEGRGLAVPGMPVGSPGMEVEGAEQETYSVIIFGPSGQRIFARYRGALAI
jgi:hypothetical protein